MKVESTQTMLGYTNAHLHEHMRSFVDWEHLQKGRWHLDHIFPVSAFFAHGITDPKVINALDNLRPLSGRENCSKGARYNKREFERYLNRKGIRPT